MEYPKMLYKGGDIAAETLIVDGPAAEKDAEKEGFIRLWAGAIKAPRKPWEDAPAEVAQEADIESLRAEAEAKGVKVDRRWKEDRLRAEIEAVK